MSMPHSARHGVALCGTARVADSMIVLYAGICMAGLRSAQCDVCPEL